VAKKELLILEPILLSCLSSLSGTDAVHPMLKLSLGIYKEHRQVASCHKHGHGYTQSSVHGIVDCQPSKLDAVSEELAVFPINFGGGDTQEGR
jgi:hypothetical protein